MRRTSSTYYGETYNKSHPKKNPFLGNHQHYGFGGGGFGEPGGDHLFMGGAGLSRGVFSECYRIFPASMLPGNDRPEINYGGKIILPPSALAQLSQLHIEYPMLFSLANEPLNIVTHAGVLEFIAEEGRMYAPNWMLSTLVIQPGQLIRVKNVSLPLGKFVKIQPQSVDFLDIADPKAVLEKSLRSFSTLTVGNIMSIAYNDKVYDILVMEVKPDTRSHGISIIETDLEVDFAPPLGYVEPDYKAAALAASKASSANSLEGTVKKIEQHVKKDEPTPNSFQAFKGQGRKLNNKPAPTPLDPLAESALTGSGGDDSSTSDIPAALHLPPGKFFFGYPVKPLRSTETDAMKDKTPKEPLFQGVGKTLRKKK